ncbi:unnamed protein product [Leptidea sinapis]|uniref:Ommochrome-binding protein-like n=1 Tax=Leptidea sinapis TaxID=189913 RepID=A0A5E4QYJ9_9NEOP|nr:unnamed protein product [Leptidea sinapis]
MARNNDKVLLVIVIITIASVISQAVNEPEACTDCYKVEQICHTINYLFDLEAPFRESIVITKLDVLRSTNTLFFTFEPNVTDREYKKVGFINIDDPRNTSIISGGHQTLNFGTFALDQDNSLVYLGGSDGIYVLDTKSNRVAPYSSRGDTVLSLFYKGHVYFVRFGEQKIIKKKGDNFDVIIEHIPVRNFVINKDYEIVFTSTYGLYVARRDETYWLSKNAYFRGLVIDLDDNVYAWWIDGIYKVTIEKQLAKSRVEIVAKIEGLNALTFDNDNNFLFASGKSVYRLINANTTNC